MADLELETRGSDWLHRRCFCDRRRILDPRTRARAFLTLAKPLIERLRATEARDETERARFFSLVERVEKIERGHAYYEVIDGVAYMLGPLRGVDDPRLRVIDAAAAMVRIGVRELDAAACRVARYENATLRVGESWTATLPRCPSSTTRPARSPAYGPAPAPARPRYDGTQLISICERLENASRADRQVLAEQMLGELDDHLRPETDGPDTVEVRPHVLLVVASELLSGLDVALQRAVARKASMLAREFPRARGTEDDYLRRADDLDAELAQPIREKAKALQDLMIGLAYHACEYSRWPGSREQRKSARARALAQRLRGTIRISKAEHETAVARLGFGTTDAI